MTGVAVVYGYFGVGIRGDDRFSKGERVPVDGFSQRCFFNCW